jgi:flagellar biosynthesis protein FlhF
MKIKRYFAPDIKRAIRMVRREQGPDAVIISNRSVPGGVELVAAIDYDESMMQKQEDKKESSTKISTDSSAELKEYISTNALDETLQTDESSKSQESRSEISADIWNQDPVLVEMKNEIKDLRQMLESQMSGLAWGDYGKRQPLHARLIRELMAFGLSMDVAQELVNEIPGDLSHQKAWLKATAVLANRIDTTDDDILSHGGVVALLGPTGVGKTTTIAKLAARYTLRHGKNKVLLLSTDNYRIAAHEQLRIYGKIIGAPVINVTGADELEEAVNCHLDKGLILVDTAGFSPADQRLHEQLVKLDSDEILVKKYLVLQATTQIEGLENALHCYQDSDIKGTIITKLDEAINLGDVISVVIRHGLPVAYVSDGQKVPEDIHPARSDNLAHMCVKNLDEIRQAVGNEALEMAYRSMVVNADA